MARLASLSLSMLALAALGLALAATSAPARADEPASTTPKQGEQVEEETFVVEHDGQPLRVRVRKLVGGDTVEVQATDEAPRVMKAMRIVRPKGPAWGLPRDGDADDDDADDDDDDAPQRRRIHVEMEEGRPVIVWRGADGKVQRIKPGQGPMILGGDLDGITDAHPRMRRLRELFVRNGATDGDDAPLMRRLERLEQENRRMRGELTRLQHQMQRLMGARGMGPDRPMGPPAGAGDRLERIEKLLEKLVSGRTDGPGPGGPTVRAYPQPGRSSVVIPHVEVLPHDMPDAAQREMRERMERAQKQMAEQRERMHREQAQQRERVEARMHEVERTLKSLEDRLREANEGRRAAMEEAAALRAQKAALEEALRAAHEKAASGAK